MLSLFFFIFFFTFSEKHVMFQPCFELIYVLIYSSAEIFQGHEIWLDSQCGIKSNNVTVKPLFLDFDPTNVTGQAGSCRDIADPLPHIA